MHSYVILYRFQKEDLNRNFKEKVLAAFPRHQDVTDAGFEYIGVAGGEEPAVVDTLNGILNEMGIGREGFFGQNDYVALYFSRDKDDDDVKRQLLIGTQDMVDKDAETMSADAHRNAILNLLKVDYAKAQPNK
ncbi:MULTISPECIES: hypothetical protein [Pontibacter]|uniref:Uncharacterized protein n=1 Tax=Pontibacter lucknowensis TaxID=1077936 RepID=A0A1N6X1B2_9BACT|nr:MULTISPECIES: hypothetical protein [Pontibacter]EJF08618.1 hypothetical protein O71_19827 [Pontibacter sp. BAB1700]SIQ96132.1 hypothetical protein SAMN05421545_1872 [Pontibacter lucknowensis]